MIKFSAVFIALLSHFCKFGTGETIFEYKFAYFTADQENRLILMETEPYRLNFQLFTSNNDSNMKQIVENGNINIQPTILHEKNAILLNQTLSIDPNQCSRSACNLSLDIEALFLGRTSLKFKLVMYGDVGYIVENDVLPISVLRHKEDAGLTRVFTVVLAVMVFSNNIIMGMQLDWHIIVSVLKKPIAPLISFTCQFGMMPLFATAYAYLMLAGRPALQFGYFAVGCSPGGGQSNMWSLLLDGSLDLSITVTFISNVAALAMMPLWLFTVGQLFYKNAAPGEQIEIPFKDIIVSLVLLISPIFVGILIKYFKPAIAQKSRKIVKYSTFCVILIVVPLGVYANRFVFRLITWKTIVCGFCLPWSGFAIGFVAALILRQNFCYAKTVAIETGFQNGSIAMLVMNFSLPKPDGDLGFVMPFCVFIFTPLPLFVALVVKTIWEKIKERQESNKSPFVPVRKTETKKELLEQESSGALLEMDEVGESTETREK